MVQYLRYLSREKLLSINLKTRTENIVGSRVFDKAWLHSVLQENMAYVIEFTVNLKNGRVRAFILFYHDRAFPLDMSREDYERLPYIEVP